MISVSNDYLISVIYGGYGQWAYQVFLNLNLFVLLWLSN